MEVESEYYDAFVIGQKTIEGRKNKPDGWGCVVKGDTVLLKEKGSNSSRFFTVMETRLYKSIEEYLHKETLERTLPGVTTIEEGVAIYLGFWGSEGTKEVAKHGIIAIELRPGRF